MEKIVTITIWFDGETNESYLVGLMPWMRIFWTVTTLTGYSLTPRLLRDRLVSGGKT